MIIIDSNESNDNNDNNDNNDVNESNDNYMIIIELMIKIIKMIL